MSTLYEELKTLDLGVAETYKKVTRNNPYTVIGSAGAKTLFAGVIADKKITQREARALLKVIGTARFDKLALWYLIEDFKQSVQNGSMGSKRLTGADLEPVRQALHSRLVGKIEFVSPLTHVTYSPDHYRSILQLVEQGDIEVYEVEIGVVRHLGADAAMYDATSNRIHIYTGLEQREMLSAVVHEASHAIQDWLDMSPLHQDAEADAYLAGAVAEHALKTNRSKFFDGTPHRVAFDAVEPLLAPGRILDAGKPLRDALDLIRKAVMRHPSYVKTDLKFSGGDDAAAGERDRLLKVFAALRAASRRPR